MFYKSSPKNYQGIFIYFFCSLPFPLQPEGVHQEYMIWVREEAIREKKIWGGKNKQRKEMDLSSLIDSMADLVAHDEDADEGEDDDKENTGERDDQWRK